jgi:hypothetical protein
MLESSLPEVDRMNLKRRKNNPSPNSKEIERLIDEQKSKPFDATILPESSVTQKELDDFLKWRRDTKRSEREAQKNWR